MKKSILIKSLLVITVLLCATLFLWEDCSFLKNKNELTITNWNVQTFFDGNNDGIEYSNFRKSKETWNETFYEQRLKRLCKIIEEIDSDVFVMEELENEKILYDISNMLSHNVWFKNKMYNYAAFGKESGNSIGCGLISKIKIQNVKLHGINIQTENCHEPKMRSIMEVKFDDGKNKICLFVNHWKSKSGGQEKSEKWRLWQENVLSREFINAKENLTFACGDFNKDIDDFSCNQNDELFFTTIGEQNNQTVNVYSPWNFEKSKDYGSYFFNGKWEKIDHFFLRDKNVLKDFKVESNSKIVKEDGTPNRYELFSHKGYSDHLPITVTLKLPD